MKSIIIATLTAIIATTTFAEQKTNEFAKAKNLEELKKMRQQKLGGYLLLDTQGEAAIFTSEDPMAVKAAQRAARQMTKILKVRVACRKMKDPATMATASAMLASSKAAAAVYVVSEGDMPLTLVAPEARWGFVNSAKLCDATLAENKKEDRLYVAIFRTLANVMGGYGSQYPGTIMEMITTPKEIEEHADYSLLPDSQMAIVNAMGHIGLKQGRLVSYYRACKEGIAPMPTNEVQKAIWEQVKAEANTKPSNPLKITKEKK